VDRPAGAEEEEELAMKRVARRRRTTPTRRGLRWRDQQHGRRWW
jgi:hypothetical protein